jgi:hypothetical protein
MLNQALGTLTSSSIIDNSYSLSKIDAALLIGTFRKDSLNGTAQDYLILVINY